MVLTSEAERCVEDVYMFSLWDCAGLCLTDVYVPLDFFSDGGILS